MSTQNTMDATITYFRANGEWFWNRIIKPDAPGIIAFVIAVLVMILLICIGHHLVQDERADMQEGMVGGSGFGAEYPGPSGLYPGTHDDFVASLQPMTMTLYSDPTDLGQPLTPSCKSNPVGTPIYQNVAHDARWIASRAGWSYGPMSGQHGLVGIGSPPN